MESRMHTAQSEAVLSHLRSKAAALPRVPGVYIMHSVSGKVIYVGKSRSLRDRVSQYFHGAHDVKTARMAGSVHDFDFIVCDTEMEALAQPSTEVSKTRSFVLTATRSGRAQ